MRGWGVIGGVMLALAAAAHAARPGVVGQWIWCDADRRHFEAARAGDPSLVPALFVSTITVESGAVVQHLALPPTYVDAPGGAALVVRFDDSFHAFWSLGDGAAARASVAGKLAWILERADAMGVRLVELQLDYDCPVRRLREWAALLGELASGPLAGRTVWITSLPAHVAVAEYGDWFRGVVAGHVLQVFDVGPALTVADAPRLAAVARAQRMSFRLGVGAFERVRGPERVRVTEHGRWLDAVDEFADDPTFRGLWIFPGGMPWRRVP
jgi:uncharacterized protein DUF3142